MTTIALNFADIFYFCRKISHEMCNGSNTITTRHFSRSGRLAHPHYRTMVFNSGDTDHDYKPMAPLLWSDGYFSGLLWLQIVLLLLPIPLLLPLLLVRLSPAGICCDSHVHQRLFNQTSFFTGSSFQHMK